MKPGAPLLPLVSSSFGAVRTAGVPRMNLSQLAMVAVAGEIVPPKEGRSPYRIGRDGVPRILPGPGGIVLNHRVGDPCVGLAADHLEPGAAVENRQKSAKGEPDGHNLAFNTYACIGNTALVLTGPCQGKTGVVTGKHGGVNHVLVDFPPTVLRRLRIGDKIQIYAYGLGLELPDYPSLHLYNCAPRLIRRWAVRALPPRLYVPVTHALPAAVMGSGLGRDNAARGDYDIQLFDPQVRKRFGLDRLRFGDLVAILHADTRYGRAYHRSYTTIGVVVHGDSAKSGHGPGVVTLISGESRYLEPVRDDRANLAAVLGLRELPLQRPNIRLLESGRTTGHPSRLYV
jgi:hypothetical protein